MVRTGTDADTSSPYSTLATNSASGGRCSKVTDASPVTPVSWTKSASEPSYGSCASNLTNTQVLSAWGWRCQVTVTVLWVAVAVRFSGGACVAARVAADQSSASGVSASSGSRNSANISSRVPSSSSTIHHGNLSSARSSYVHESASSRRCRTRNSPCGRNLACEETPSAGAGFGVHVTPITTDSEAISIPVGAGNASASSTCTASVTVTGVACESVTLARNVLAGVVPGTGPIGSAGIGPQLARCDSALACTVSPSMVSV